MALTTTTANGAISADQTTIKVTSGTGFGKNKLIRVDDEFMQQSADADSASTTIIPVIRGVNGSVAKAHPTSANVIVGNPYDDFTGNADATAATYPLAGRQRRVVSYSASGAITLPSPGTDMVAVLNGTSVLAMTIAAPTKDMDGNLLYVVANGAAAHTVTVTGGISGAGSSYDVVTLNGTGPVCLQFVACNALWMSMVATPMAGTVTNITATVA